MTVNALRHGENAFLSLEGERSIAEYAKVLLQDPLSLRPHAVHPAQHFHGMVYLCALPTQHPSRIIAGHEFSSVEIKCNSYDVTNDAGDGVIASFSKIVFVCKSSCPRLHRWKLLEIRQRTTEERGHHQIALYHALTLENTATHPELKMNLANLGVGTQHWRLLPESRGFSLCPSEPFVHQYVLALLMRGVSWFGFPEYRDFAQVLRTAHPSTLHMEEDHGLAYAYAGTHLDPHVHSNIHWVLKRHGVIPNVPGTAQPLHYFLYKDSKGKATIQKLVVGVGVGKSTREQKERGTRPSETDVCLCYYSRAVNTHVVNPSYPPGSLQAQVHRYLSQHSTLTPAQFVEEKLKKAVDKSSFWRWMHEPMRDGVGVKVQKAVEKFLKEEDEVRREESVAADE